MRVGLFQTMLAIARAWQPGLIALGLAMTSVGSALGEDRIENTDQVMVAPYPAESPWFDEIAVRDLPKKSPSLTTGTSKIRLRGRIDSDFIWVDQSAKNEAAFGKLNDADGLRRARLGIEGSWTPETRYLVELDFASGEVVVRDLFVGIGRINEAGEWRAGHFREPFSLEGSTSANSFALMERSSINQLDPARNWGLGYFRCTDDEDMTFAIGAFHAGTDSSDFENGAGSNTAITARGTWLPWYESHGMQLLHLGVAGSIRVPDEGVVIVSQGPSSPLLDFADSSTSPFVPRLTIPTHSQQLVNFQLAIVNGPFSAQLEWYGSFIDQTDGAVVFFDGSYVQVGYFLTGEHRNYLPQQGTFGAVSVKRPLLPGLSVQSKEAPRGFGAWELIGRMSYLDFFDQDSPRGPTGQLTGVRLPQATFGVNWYLADRMRILLDYTLAVPDEPNTGTSTASLLSTRLALHW